ncbi:hypothetical protein KC330_g2 [Hortaea werneckii]|nr:hypothetical protein KC330_g2 [Hortaea werneckii]
MPKSLSWKLRLDFESLWSPTFRAQKEENQSLTPFPLFSPYSLLSFPPPRNPPPKSSYRNASSSGRNPTKKSLVISKLNQLLAILGATFNRFDALVLVSHSGHGVDLEAATEDVERIGAGLGDAAGDGAGAELAEGGGLGLVRRGEGVSDGFVDHEIEADVGGDAGDGGDDAAVEGGERRGVDGLVEVEEEERPEKEADWIDKRVRTMSRG